MTQERSVPDRLEETLRRMLSDPSPVVRDAAGAALDRIRAKRAVGSYIERLRSAGLEERMRIVHSAGEIGGSEGQAILIAALSDAEAAVRGAAARALADFPTAEALGALRARMEGESGVVLANIVEALGRSGRRDLAPAIERYLDHSDPEVRGRAVVAWARTAGGPWWEQVLARAGDRAEAVREAVARALGEWSAG